MQIPRSELSSNAKEGEQPREAIPNNLEDESLESLDSLYSSKTGESLDALPPFNSPLAPTTPTNDTADKSNPRSWKKYASGRSSSNSIATGSSSSKSTSFRINTKLFKSSPKKLFKGSNNKKEVAATPNQSTITQNTPPSRPVSSISQQQQTQQLSPLTPMNNAQNGTAEYTAASTNSTPTANNIHNMRSNNSTPEISNKLDHIKVPVIETTQETKPNNDNELKAALDKLGKNVDALKILSPKASASSIISPTDSEIGYSEFLKLIDHNKDGRMNEKEDEASSEEEQDKKEEQSNENECQCWCPDFLRNILCGKSKSAIVQSQPIEYQVYLDEDEEPNNHNHVEKEEKKSWADELKDKARVRQIVQDCKVNE